jgi:SAM-dependent methyltransferase
MSAITTRLAWRALIDSASAPYRRSGRFAWHFARGKLRWDPVFGHLLARGVIAPRTRVLDIGCGQGLLASLIQAAAAAATQGRWPDAWAEAPVDVHVRGIELRGRDVERARDALGASADLVCADMRTTAFGQVDAVVLLDVLHYVSIADQDAVLARARAALPDGGRLVLRVGDAAARRGFAIGDWVDRIVTLAHGQRPGRHFGRTLAAWNERLDELGFTVVSEPMHRGTPFANVLLLGTVARAPAPTVAAHGVHVLDRAHAASHA